MFAKRNVAWDSGCHEDAIWYATTGNLNNMRHKINRLIYWWRSQDWHRKLDLGNLNGHCVFHISFYVINIYDYCDTENFPFFLCSSFLTASCRSNDQNNETFDCNSEGCKGSERLKFKFDGSFNRTFPSEDNLSNSPDSSKSFGETQLDVFHHRHGLLILHLLATMMFAPSVVAWFQV